MNMEYCHTTASGAKKIHLKFIELTTTKLMQYLEKTRVRNACKIGCINYNWKWCCPPDSKTLDMLAEDYTYVIIVCVYVYLSDFKSVQNRYLKIRAANAILTSQSNKISRKIENDLNGLALLSGSCNLCKPCAKKINLPCKKPTKMRFSLESTGVNVCKLLYETMDFELQWYKKDFIPHYTAVTSGILSRDKPLFDKESIYSVIS